VESVRVYVQLLGEGVVVFRPAQAELLGPRIARLVVPTDYNAGDEDWEFKPGSVVGLERRSFEDWEGWIAISPLPPEDIGAR
jgi:hypothetical protein